jgi:stearoyl-CoA desaturase (delta-9 desaturase)
MNKSPVKAKYQFGFVFSFALLHLAALAVCILTPWSRAAFLWLAGSYMVRMFGVTGGYHRYFSHRSYKMNRTAQFALAVLAQASGQKGVLWWAAHHRTHHRHSDAEGDIHSPVKRGFWWSHVGWVVSNEHDDYDQASVRDLARYPELRWLDRHHWVPTAAYALAVLLIGGTQAFLWGYIVSTVVLYHCTFSINSLAHVWGSRPFVTRDGSRNNFWLALLTLGEGWHNNHHFSSGSCRQGYRWWEIDLTYYILRVFSFFGLTRDLRPFRQPLKRASL